MEERGDANIVVLCGFLCEVLFMRFLEKLEAVEKTKFLLPVPFLFIFFSWESRVYLGTWSRWIPILGQQGRRRAARQRFGGWILLGMRERLSSHRPLSDDGGGKRRERVSRSSVLTLRAIMKIVQSMEYGDGDAD